MDYETLEDGFAETSRGRLHYRRHRAQGKKVVFLHGFGASVRVWKRLVEALPDGLDICLIDMLGFGDSDAPRTDYTMDLQAMVIGEFLQKQGLGDAYLFGHSYGGWAAAQIASGGSYRGGGIILEDCAGLKEQVEADIAQSGDAYKEALEKEAIGLGTKEYVAKSALDSETPDALLTRERLSGIVKPTLIIWGSEDKVVPARYASVFNECIKGSVLEMVAGAGHVAHYTHAGVVASFLLRFIGMS